MSVLSSLIAQMAWYLLESIEESPRVATTHGGMMIEFNYYNNSNNVGGQVATTLICVFYFISSSDQPIVTARN